jgi:hypothetical protein
MQVAETLQAGWQLVAMECDVPTVVLGPGSIRALVDPLGTAHCTFTNTQTTSGLVNPTSNAAPDATDQAR